MMLANQCTWFQYVIGIFNLNRSDFDSNSFGILAERKQKAANKKRARRWFPWQKQLKNAEIFSRKKHFVANKKRRMFTRKLSNYSIFNLNFHLNLILKRPKRIPRRDSDPLFSGLTNRNRNTFNRKKDRNCQLTFQVS